MGDHKLSLILFLMILLNSTSVMAHEFWLEPVDYQRELQQDLAVNLKVGQNFKGEPQIYNPSDFIKFQLTEFIDKAATTHAIKSRLGDIPALRKKSEREGLKIVSYISNANLLTYNKAEKFTAFLKNEGLDWVLAAHKKRKLPEKGFKEVFHRYAKTLIAVGRGRGEDIELGLPFEWVLEKNPYTDKDNLQARLLWEGKAFPNTTVTLFIRQQDTLIQKHLMTDKHGVVTIPTDQHGIFLLNAVHMIEASDDTEREIGAVWESLWASTTFEITDK